MGRIHPLALRTRIPQVTVHDPPASPFDLRRYDSPVWMLVTEQPEGIFAESGVAPWHELRQTAARKTLDASNQLTQQWGDYNRVTWRHPMSRVVPLLGQLTDLPTTPLPGDAFMLRVQTPNVGASQRLVVAPGREDEGLFHMPGGQSGHPLSPFYRAGHDHWVRGEPLPLRLETPLYELVLRRE